MQFFIVIIQREQENKNQTSAVASETLDNGLTDRRVHLITAVKIHYGELNTGYGIAAMSSNSKMIKAWTYKERKEGIKEVEENEIVKMAMIRTIQEG
ncbi:hypothetical protein ACH5RR_007016 [Cinchona calisaya]|uniref:Uncharacterized protein n=1 Tax=Cinchona calisaya TaxID=153742 RepID=A0ABD3AQQ6_9GENT